MSYRSLKYLSEISTWTLPKDCKIQKRFNGTEETAVFGMVDGKIYAFYEIQDFSSKIDFFDPCQWGRSFELSNDECMMLRKKYYEVYGVTFNQDQLERLIRGVHSEVTFTSLVREVIDEQNKREKGKIIFYKEVLEAALRELEEVRNSEEPILRGAAKGIVEKIQERIVMKT